MSDYYKHESAIVDKGAQIGQGSRVWHEMLGAGAGLRRALTGMKWFES